MEETISVSEFKAKCLGIFQRLADRRLAKVTVTRRGKPVAVVTSQMAHDDWLDELRSDMRGSVVIPEGFDLTAPVFEGEIDAELGILHR